MTDSAAMPQRASPFDHEGSRVCTGRCFDPTPKIIESIPERTVSAVPQVIHCTPGPWHWSHLRASHNALRRRCSSRTTTGYCRCWTGSGVLPPSVGKARVLSHAVGAGRQTFILPAGRGGRVPTFALTETKRRRRRRDLSSPKSVPFGLSWPPRGARVLTQSHNNIRLQQRVPCFRRGP